MPPISGTPGQTDHVASAVRRLRAEVARLRRRGAPIPCACTWVRAQAEREEGRVKNKQKRRYLSLTLKRELIYSSEECRDSASPQSCDVSAETVTRPSMRECSRSYTWRRRQVILEGQTSPFSPLRRGCVRPRLGKPPSLAGTPKRQTAV